MTKGVDGIIAEATKSAYANPNIDLFKQLQARGIPVVMIHATYPDLHIPVIEVDDRRGSYLAVRHLIELGHHRIGAIMKMDDRQGLRRMEGFLSALNESGLTYNSDHVAFYTTEQQSSISVSYVHGLTQMDTVERPTAIFCYNDSIATHLLSALRQNDLSVPEDISVVGFDDAPMASQSFPPLTTIEHPKHEMGTLAADTILHLIRREPVRELVYTFNPHLVERSSVRSMQTLEV